MAASSAATLERSVVLTFESPIALLRSLKVEVITVDDTLDPLKSAVKSLWAWLVDMSPAMATASSEITGFRVWKLKWNPA